MEKRAMTRRRFLSGALVGAAGAALAACAVTPQVVEKEVEKVVKETVIVKETVVVEKEVPVAKEGPVQIELWWAVGPEQEACVRVFQEKHPDIVVDLVDLGEAVYGTPKFTTAVAAGRGPDVAYQNRHTFQQFSARGLYLALDDFMQRDGYSVEDFPAEQMKALSWEGLVYGLPYEVGTYMFFWNRAHFGEVGLNPDEPPKTWDEIELFTDKLTIKSNGQFQRFGFIPSFPPGLRDKILTIALTNGADTMDESGRKSMLGTDEWIEALDWMVRFTDEYCGGFETATGGMQAFAGQAQDMFASGTISMSSYGAWMIGHYAAFPELEYDGTPIMPVASHLLGRKINWVCDWSFAMTPKKGGHPEEGWTLVKFLIGPDAYDARAGIGMELSRERWKREGLPGEPLFYAQPPAYKASRQWMVENIYSKYPDRQRNMAELVADTAEWGRECGILGGLAATELWVEIANAQEAALAHTLTPKEAMLAAASNHQRALDEAWEKLAQEKG